VKHGHPLSREGQGGLEKINGRLYEKIYIDGVWYRVPLLTKDELYPPETWDIKSYQSDRVVWDDVRVAASSIRIQGVSNIPDWGGVGDGNLYALAFDPTTMEQVFFTVQLPHTYKLGTNIHPHIHWMPETTDTGTVRWGLEYEWVNIGDSMTGGSTITIDDDGDGTLLKHQIAEFAELSGVGKGMSSMLICRVYRDATNDDFADDAYLLEIDFHFEIDSLGSRQEYVK
jgi:hypothetical protein